MTNYERTSECEPNEQRGSGIGLGITMLLIGVGAGALTALLLAPRSGRRPADSGTWNCTRSGESWLMRKHFSVLETPWPMRM